MPQLVARARAEKADAVLVSQVVTQRDAHLLNTKEMSAAFRESYPSEPAAAADRRRSALRREDGRRARRGPGVLPGHDAPARWPRTSTHQLVTRRTEEGERMSDGTRVGLRVTHRRYVPLLARALRRRPRGRRLLPGPVRGRRHRGLHPHRRRRGAVRVVLRRAVPGPGARPGTCWRSTAEVVAVGRRSRTLEFRAVGGRPGAGGRTSRRVGGRDARASRWWRRRPPGVRGGPRPLVLTAFPCRFPCRFPLAGFPLPVSPCRYFLWGVPALASHGRTLNWRAASSIPLETAPLHLSRDGQPGRDRARHGRGRVKDRRVTHRHAGCRKNYA